MLAIYKRIAQQTGLSVEKVMSVALKLSYELVFLPASKLTAEQRREYAAAHRAAADKLVAARTERKVLPALPSAKALLLSAPDKPRHARRLHVNGSGR